MAHRGVWTETANRAMLPTTGNALPTGGTLDLQANAVLKKRASGQVVWEPVPLQLAPSDQSRRPTLFLLLWSPARRARAAAFDDASEALLLADTPEG